MTKEYSVYIMVSTTSVMYIGVSSDLRGRVWEHKNCTYKNSFTSKYQCNILIFYEDYDSLQTSINREKQLKNWTRSKKEWLVKQLNPNWFDLSRDWY